MMVMIVELTELKIAFVIVNAFLSNNIYKIHYHEFFLKYQKTMIRKLIATMIILVVRYLLGF